MRESVETYEFLEQLELAEKDGQSDWRVGGGRG